MRFILLTLLIFSCQPVQTHYETTSLAQAKLIGTWYLNEEDLYNKIYVQDSLHLALDSHLDTMFFYTYRLRHDTLFLYGKYQQLVNYNIILKLTDDSLIFANLLDKEGIQRYARKESTQEKNSR